METEQLKAIQAPLKQRYSGDPAAAVLTLTADGDLGAGVSCSVGTGRALAEAGLHPETSASEEELATMLKLTERYCVVFQTLRCDPPAGKGKPEDAGGAM